jgi:hypothetical protein
LGFLSDRDCFSGKNSCGRQTLHEKIKTDCLDEHEVKGDERNEGKPAEKNRAQNDNGKGTKTALSLLKICCKRDGFE